MKITRSFPIISVAVGLLGTGFFSPQARAQSEADASFAAWNNVFLRQSGNVAYYIQTTNVTSESQINTWDLALDIIVVEDTYNRTRTATLKTLVENLLNTYVAVHGSNLNSSGWYDDAGWETIAFTRGYQITGDTNFLNYAESGWASAYSDGWDTTYAGGVFGKTAAMDPRIR